MNTLESFGSSVSCYLASAASSLGSVMAQAFGRLFCAIQACCDSVAGLAARVGEIARERLAKDSSTLHEAALSPVSGPANPPIQQAPAVPPPQAARDPNLIDVQGDGNCLFYSVMIELIKKYPNDEGVISLFNRRALPTLASLGELTDCREVAAQLAPHAAQLRHQAADYLRQHKEDQRFSIALLEGFASHTEAKTREIEEDQATLRFLLEEAKRHLPRLTNQAEVNAQINSILSHLPDQCPSDLITGLKPGKDSPDEDAKVFSDAATGIANLHKKIADNRRALPNDYEEYIELARGDRCYCGIPQILALSALYKIPITVLHDYRYSVGSGATYHLQTYNPEHADKPALTLVHVNGNHFEVYRGTPAPEERSARPESPPPSPPHTGNGGGSPVQENRSAEAGPHLSHSSEGAT